jgi:hypothetical protein
METGGSSGTGGAGAAGKPVSGVIDAYVRAWNAFLEDFGNVWVATFLFWILMLGSSALVGWIPCFGGIVVAIFVQAPLWVGWYGTLDHGLSRGRADLGRLFSGFQKCYWSSVLAMLIPILVVTVVGMIGGTVLFGGVSLAAVAMGEEDLTVLIVPVILYALVYGLVSLVIWTLFLMVPLAVWEHPESGWDAVREAVGLVFTHLPQAILYVIIQLLLNLVAGAVGVLLCCAGLVFTLPFAQAWAGLALVLLYRTWREEASARGDAGAAPGESPGASPPPPDSAG